MDRRVLDGGVDAVLRHVDDGGIDGASRRGHVAGADLPSGDDDGDRGNAVVDVGAADSSARRPTAAAASRTRTIMVLGFLCVGLWWCARVMDSCGVSFAIH